MIDFRGADHYLPPKVIEHSLTLMRPKIATDSELLDIARECFLSQGPSVSTTFIAERAGVSQATLFKRFGTKADLLFKALGLDDVRPWLPRLEAGPDERPIQEQLRELARALVQFFDRALPAMMAFRASGPNAVPIHLNDGSCEDAVPGPVRARLALAKWFELGQRNGRLRAFDTGSAAIAFIGAVQGPAIRRHLAGDAIDTDGYADRFVDTFWSGIKP
jgi:AcrR family transcriptional regulator